MKRVVRALLVVGAAVQASCTERVCGTLHGREVADPGGSWANSYLPGSTHAKSFVCPGGRVVIDPKARDSELAQRLQGLGAMTFLDNEGAVAAVKERTYDGALVLALSGGGQNGAFGAGFLNAWMDWRQRPCFDVITGVSTGALQSPFVFVNTRKAADRMREAYLSAGVSELIEPRWGPGLPFSTSLATGHGLERMMRKYVGNDLIKEVAAVAKAADWHRELLVGTVNLDSGLLTIWDMVSIAKCGEYDLFRRVLLASAFQPPIFPPVCLCDAYHVDGGVRQQIFVMANTVAGYDNYLANYSLEARAAAAARVPPPQAYLLVNGYLDTLAHCTKPHIVDIGFRAIDLCTSEAIIGSIFKAFELLLPHFPLATTNEPHLFNLASMPETALVKGKTSMELTRKDMKCLYDAGYALGSQVDPWIHDPKDLNRHTAAAVCEERSR